MRRKHIALCSFVYTSCTNWVHLSRANPYLRGRVHWRMKKSAKMLSSIGVFVVSSRCHPEGEVVVFCPMFLALSDFLSVGLKGDVVVPDIGTSSVCSFLV